MLLNVFRCFHTLVCLTKCFYIENNHEKRIIFLIFLAHRLFSPQNEARKLKERLFPVSLQAGCANRAKAVSRSSARKASISRS